MKTCSQCLTEKKEDCFTSTQTKCKVCRHKIYKESHERTPDNDLIPPGPGVTTHRAGDTNCQTGMYQGHNTVRRFASPLENI